MIPHLAFLLVPHRPGGRPLRQVSLRSTPERPVSEAMHDRWAATVTASTTRTRIPKPDIGPPAILSRATVAARSSLGNDAGVGELSSFYAGTAFPERENRNRKVFGHFIVTLCVGCTAFQALAESPHVLRKQKLNRNVHCPFPKRFQYYKNFRSAGRPASVKKNSIQNGETTS
jgi:hypothetical protein